LKTGGYNQLSNKSNDLFPLLPDHPKVGSNGRLLTDCGTTAMVQIMAFHKYPTRGTGQGNIVGPHNVSVPIENLDVAYDWNNMLDRYTNANTGTALQRSAVATLMYNFGVTIGTNGTTAAMNINFGYDKSIQYHYRVYYTDAEWEAIIRKQLDLGLPVFYHGIVN
jgi:hypothetical protein